MAGPHPPSPHTPRHCRLLVDLLGVAVISIRGRWFLEWLKVRISERKDLIPRQGLYCNCWSLFRSQLGSAEPGTS